MSDLVAWSLWQNRGEKRRMKNEIKETTCYHRAYVDNISTQRPLLSFVFGDRNMDEVSRSFGRDSSLVTGTVSRPKNSAEPHLKFPWVSEASRVSRDFEDHVSSYKGSPFAQTFTVCLAWHVQ